VTHDNGCGSVTSETAETQVQRAYGKKVECIKDDESVRRVLECEGQHQVHSVVPARVSVQSGKRFGRARCPRDALNASEAVAPKPASGSIAPRG